LKEKAKMLAKSGCELWYSRNDQAKNEVGIVMDKTSMDGVVDAKRIGDMIIVARVVVGEETMNIFGTYAPQVGLGEEIKTKF